VTEREPIDLVLAGGGTLAPVHVGALDAISRVKNIKAIGGTSAGSIVAAGYAVGMTPKQMMDIFKNVFSGAVLDVSWMPWDRWGLFKGDAILKALKAHFPQRMGDVKMDLRIVVADLWTREPEVITPTSHPHIFLHDAVRCSIAIPGFFKAHRLDPTSARLYVDGGVSMNFAHSVFDDRPERTVGARFKQEHGLVVPVRTNLDYVKAMAALLMYAQDNAYISAKRYGDVITLATSGDGMDFTLSDKDLECLYADGFRSTVRWLSEQR
jgi:predicted acylesterase/phospholipase RssA